MLCSVPAGKSGLTWLDRLRSSKGFSTGGDGDIDHFLSQKPSSPSPSPHSDSSKPVPPESRRIVVGRSEISRGGAGGSAPDKEWLGIMSDVLSELFYMGGSGESSRLSGKKIPRKQTKPRLCAARNKTDNIIIIDNNNNNNNSSCSDAKSSDFVRKGENAPAVTASPNSDSNSLVETIAGNEEDEEGGEEEERELKGYSRSEVTVIDTSCGLWKSEKLVFRKKNVWKVREKKGKLRCFGRKKRKGNNDNGFGGKKKTKVLGSKEDNNGDHCPTRSSNEGNNLKNDSGEEVCKAAENDLNAKEEVSKDEKKRFHFSRSPRKMRKGGSAVVLVKGIPMDKKNISKLSNNISTGTH